MNNKFSSNDLKIFPSTSGIYCISFKNSNSKKVYIGSASKNYGKIKSSNGFYSRWRSHLHALKKGSHHSIALQNAYNKYGDNNIVFIILEECIPSECIAKEQFYINKYNSYNKGYNGRPNANSNLGFKQSEKQKNTIKNKYREIRNSYLSKILNLYNDNKTTREISKILNISRGVIVKIFKENNISAKNTAFYRKKTLFQYKLNGEFVKEWDNINDCCSFLGTAANSIKYVTNGRCIHSKGFHFSFIKLNETEVLKRISDLTIKSKNVKYKNIKQLDDVGNTIKTWRDISEIIDYYGFKNKYGIWKAILKKDSSKKGYYKNFYWSL